MVWYCGWSSKVAKQLNLLETRFDCKMMKETKKTNGTFALMVIKKDNSSLTNEHTSCSKPWIINRYSFAKRFNVTVHSWWQSKSLRYLPNKQKNQLIDLTFLFYSPHHLLNNLNIYYCTTTNNKITKASLSMILSSWSICSFNFTQCGIWPELIK